MFSTYGGVFEYTSESEPCEVCTTIPCDICSVFFSLAYSTLSKRISSLMDPMRAARASKYLRTY